METTETETHTKSPPASPASSIDAPASSTKALKDRQCPFCNQPFTSSSLGRHLDLYIKSKNPKPPDGVHDVEEIRRIRGGITRRQPKSSAKNATSTGFNSPDPRADTNDAPSTGTAFKTRVTEDVNNESAATSPTVTKPAEGQPPAWQRANWLATGVINDLPPRVASRENSDHAAGQAQRITEMRSDSRGNKIPRPEFESESMSKLEEAAELGRAAEMALREVLGSLEAAQKKLEPSVLFDDCDFFSLSFPGLCLAILPPPTTLFSPAPFPSADSWTIHPPGVKQFESINRALHERFKTERQHVELSDSVVFHHHTHLGAAWEHWQNMTESDRAQAWNLQILRSFAQANSRVAGLRADVERAEQRTRHLEVEYDRLSRCQLPREYLSQPPNTVPVASSLLRQAHPSLQKSGVAEVNFDADALISKWRSSIKATSRPSRTSYANNVATPAATTAPPTAGTEVLAPSVYYPKTNSQNLYIPNLRDDMIMSGSVFGVGGPMPRQTSIYTLHTTEANDRRTTYETPPEPGTVVGTDDETSPGMEDGAAVAAGPLALRNAIEPPSRRGSGSSKGNGLLNGNGKRPLGASVYNPANKVHRVGVTDERPM